MWEKERQRWECAGTGQHRGQGRGGQSRGWSRLTAAAVLIRAIPTVVRPITHPELGDAAVVVALELHRVAELVWERRGGAQSWGNAAGRTQQQHVARLSQLGARAGAGDPACPDFAVPPNHAGAGLMWDSLLWSWRGRSQFLGTVGGLFREVGTKTITQMSCNWAPLK